MTPVTMDKVIMPTTVVAAMLDTEIPRKVVAEPAVNVAAEIDAAAAALSVIAAVRTPKTPNADRIWSLLIPFLASSCWRDLLARKNNNLAWTISLIQK